MLKIFVVAQVRASIEGQLPQKPRWPFQSHLAADHEPPLRYATSTTFPWSQGHCSSSGIYRLRTRPSTGDIRPRLESRTTKFNGTTRNCFLSGSLSTRLVCFKNQRFNSRSSRSTRLVPGERRYSWATSS